MAARLDSLPVPGRIIDKIEIAKKKAKPIANRLGKSKFLSMVEFRNTPKGQTLYLRLYGESSPAGFKYTKRFPKDIFTGSRWWSDDINITELIERPTSETARNYAKAYMELRRWQEMTDDELATAAGIQLEKVKGDNMQEYRDYISDMVKLIRAVTGLNDTQLTRVNQGLAPVEGDSDIDGISAFEQFKEKFDSANEDDENAALFDKVYGLLRKLGIKPEVTDIEGSNVVAEYVQNGVLRVNRWKWNRIDEQLRADTILHEMIHGVTAYIINSHENPLIDLPEALDNLASYAVTAYKAVMQGDPYEASRFKGKYSIENPHEILAELANSDLRNAYKKRKLWVVERNGKKMAFGQEVPGSVETTAWEVFNEILDGMIKNFDQSMFDRYRNGNKLFWNIMSESPSTTRQYARGLASGSMRTAPNGETSNLTNEEWATVRSDEFKDEFGDWEKNPESSKVELDENGEPVMSDVVDKLGMKALEEGTPETPEEDEDDVPMLRERTKAAPKKTKKVYKLMRLGEDGKLYPLYIDRNAMPIELGQWYDADSPEVKDLEGLDAGYAYLLDSEGNAIDRKRVKRTKKGISGLPNVKAVTEAAANGQRWMTVTIDAKGNRAYANVGINGSEGTTTYALRPGWHAGSLPSMRQIGKGKDRNIRDNSFVWVEGEISADVDYQPEADANTSTKDIPTHIPTDGYYMKATNANKKASQADRIGWYIAGAFKPNRIISDSEARSIIDDWNAEHPNQKVEYDFVRENGMDFNAETMSFEERRLSFGERFDKELQEQIDGTQEKGHVYEMGMPGPILKSTGFPDLPIRLQASILNEKSNDSAHQYDLSELKGLADAIQKPWAIFAYGNKEKAQNLIVGIEHNGKQFLVGISFNPIVNGQFLQINSVRNVFPKDNDEWLLWIQKGLALRIDAKDKIQNIINDLRINPVDFANNELDLNTVAKIVNDFENPSIVLENSSETNQLRTEKEITTPSTDMEAVKTAAEDFAKRLGDHRIEIRRAPKTGRRRNAMGEFAIVDGKPTVIVYIDNNPTVEDVKRTILHEFVGHYGIRALLGKDFDKELRDLYDIADRELKARIDDVLKELRKRSPKADVVDAVEEYISQVAENGPLDANDAGLLARAWGFVRRALRRLGFKVGMKDEDINYLVWCSRRNIERGVDVIHDADRILQAQQMRERARRAHEEDDNDDGPDGDGGGGGSPSGPGGYDYDDSDVTPMLRKRKRQMAVTNELSDVALHDYEMNVESLGHLWTEQFLDKHAAVKAAVDAILKEGGTEAKSGQRVVELLNQEGSKASRMMSQFRKKFMDPIYKDIERISKELDVDQSEIYRYMFLRSGYERNIVFAARDAVKNDVTERMKKEASKKAYERKIAQLEAENTDLNARLTELRNDRTLYSTADFDRMERELLDKITANDFSLNNMRAIVANLTHEIALLTSCIDAVNEERDRERREFTRGDSAANEAKITAINNQIKNLKRKIETAKNSTALTDAEKDAKITAFRAEIAAKEEERMPLLSLRRYYKNRKTDYGGLTGNLSEYHDANGNVVERREDFRKRDRKNETRGEYSRMIEESLTLPDYLKDDEGNPDIVKMEEEAIRRFGNFERRMQDEADMSVSEFWHNIKDATNHTLDIEHDHHNISSDMHDYITGMMDYYIPMRGFEQNTASDLYDYVDSNNNNAYQEPIKKAEGRESRASDPLAMMLAMNGTAAKRAAHNDAVNALRKLVADNPDNSLISMRPIWYEATGETDAEGREIWQPVFGPDTSGMTQAEAKKALDDWEADMNDRKAKGEQVTKRRRDVSLRGAVVNMDANEKRQHVVIGRFLGNEYQLVFNGNPRAAQSINGDLERERETNEFLRSYAKYVRSLSQLNTTYNIPFIFSNIARDLVFGYANLGVNENSAYRRRFLKNLVKSFWRVWAFQFNEGEKRDDEISRYYREFLDSGAKTGKAVMVSRRELEDIVKYAIGATAKDRAIEAVHNFTDFMAKFAEGSEQMTRFAVYMTSREMGRDIVQSAADAKEVTVNFDKGGTYRRVSMEEIGRYTNNPLLKTLTYLCFKGGNFFKMGVMFFNASLQSLRRITLNMTGGHPVRGMVPVAIALAQGFMNTWVAALIGGGDGDDEDKDNILMDLLELYFAPETLEMKDYRTESYYMIKLGDSGKFLTIPVSQEFAPFRAMGSAVAKSFIKRYPNRDAASDILHATGELLPVNPMAAFGDEGWPQLLPEFARPIGEIIANKNFSGSIIAPRWEWNKDLPEYRRTYEGRNWNWLVEGSEGTNRLFGGDYATRAEKMIFDPEHGINIAQWNPAHAQHVIEYFGGGALTFATQAIDAIDAAISGEAPGVNDIPILKRFVYDPSQDFRNAYVQEMYSFFKDQVDTKYSKPLSQYKKGGADGEPDDLKIDALERTRAARLKELFDEYNADLKALNSEVNKEKDIKKRKSISHDRDELMRQLVEQCLEEWYKWDKSGKVRKE